MANPNDREYTNGEITVYWKPDLCIHATICFIKLRKVFDPSKRPWVNMKGANTQEIINVVDQCPTDALTWKWNRDIVAESSSGSNEDTAKREETQEPAAEITLIDGGPAIITGKIRLMNQSGEQIPSGSRISLCRCGKSKRIPFCDGSHHGDYSGK
ncbi:MAG: (4Fe-4S)-binding protein [Bacteroidales bacterium]